jgi:hypothetical protein
MMRFVGRDNRPITTLEEWAEVGTPARREH